MKTFTVASAIFLFASFSSSANDELTYNHFPALESTSAEQALCRLITFNQILLDIAQQDKVSVDDMTKIHEISYTLENALAKLSENLTQAKVDLESVHLASETLQEAVVKQHAQRYLALTNDFIKQTTCTPSVVN